MDAYPGPSPPPPPPDAPYSLVPCPLEPNEKGECADATALMVFTLSDDTNTSYVGCWPLTDYEELPQFAFSACFMWRCLPAAFSGRAYTMSVLGQRGGLDKIPAGSAMLRMDSLKAELVDVSFTLHPVRGRGEREGERRIGGRTL
jgi:hypothetical protein